MDQLFTWNVQQLRMFNQTRSGYVKKEDILAAMRSDVKAAMMEAEDPSLGAALHASELQ